MIRRIDSPLNTRSPTFPEAPARASTKAHKLPGLPELSEEPADEDIISSASTSSLIPCSQPTHTSMRSFGINDHGKDTELSTINNKRISRYGMAEFAGPQGLSELEEDLLLTAPRPAPKPPMTVQAPELSLVAPQIPCSASPPPRSRSRSPDLLSMFEMSFDLSTSSPSSCSSHFDDEAEVTPTSSQSCSTPPRYTRGPHSQSPTFSSFSDSTSTSGGSSADMPTTPTSLDDDLPPFSHKFVIPQRISIRPLIITKSPPSFHPLEDSLEEAFEFTIAPSVDPESAIEQEDAKAASKDEEDEWISDDGEWYSREMSQMVSLFSPIAPAPSRPESLPPTPQFAPGELNGARKGRSRASKPLPEIPPSPHPSAQLDPTFPRRCHSARIPNHPPPPIPTYRRTSISGSANRKSLTIRVPARPPPRTSLPADVADIFDDIASWDIPPITRSPSHSPSPLSPPRLPTTPSSGRSTSGSESAYSQANTVVSSLEPLPISLPTSQLDIDIVPSLRPSPTEASIPDTPADEMYSRSTIFAIDHEQNGGADTEYEHETGFEPMLRSRWSSSTLASLAAERAEPSSSKSFLFPFGRRVRARRQIKAAEMKEKEKRKAKEQEVFVKERRPRMSIDSAVSSAKSDSGESNTSSGLRRKPIPVEIFMRR
ncbi:hypothetical protein EW146_g1006 [Bondarzewia mesenterica]|uniref:Uncharacterized protein n=1 Tax=Bondarzewia mesenterica TaxID=1095465 RepID=A0A4S4M706_9AGAM|nr:hypothetical protein EW146_g1006 [Bondarzewia mesenterica]